jgi:hypothetical protein
MNEKFPVASCQFLVASHTGPQLATVHDLCSLAPSGQPDRSSTGNWELATEKLLSGTDPELLEFAVE